jgi:hypothetical protein
MSAMNGTGWCGGGGRDVAEGAARSAEDARRQAEAAARELQQLDPQPGALSPF